MTHSGLAAAVCAVALFAGTGYAETVPPAGQVDPRVRVVAYNPDDVVRLQGYVGYQIHMQWAPGEEFVNLGAGDAGGFDIGTEKNHFFIKPKQERVGTNLTVLTNRRAYHFDYSVAKAPSRADLRHSIVYSIRFTYPVDDALAAQQEAERRRAEQQLAEQSAQRPRNHDYWYCGTPSIKPTSAYDDGIHTRLRFPANADFPAIFLRNDDDSESLLNFHVDNDEVVIHRVARRLVLRRGELVGCVVNAGFDGGARSATYTAAPGIQRHTQGVQP